ncbi:MAG: hypothetical protein IPN12_00015 [Rhodocyclaceae bacterium]|nr:hypothetical protein [Rhodocyclaceae bacterium]
MPTSAPGWAILVERVRMRPIGQDVVAAVISEQYASTVTACPVLPVNSTSRCITAGADLQALLGDGVGGGAAAEAPQGFPVGASTGGGWRAAAVVGGEDVGLALHRRPGGAVGDFEG